MTTTVLNVSTYSFYLNGEWKESKSGQTIDIVSPYRHDVIGKVQAITKKKSMKRYMPRKSSEGVGGNFSARPCQIFI